MNTLQTEFNFVLPRGYVDERGVLHREGTMRMATALDEITPLNDPRVRQNEAYLVILLLTQVMTRLGTLPRVTPAVLERMFAADVTFLQDLYRQINEVEGHHIMVICPNCQHEFEEVVPLLGES